MNFQLNYINNNINNYQPNQFNNSLNVKVERYKGFNNEMIDYGIIIINKAYSLMNGVNARAKYIAESFDLKYPQKTKWMCFIYPLGLGGCMFYSKYKIFYYTNKERILIFNH